MTNRVDRAMQEVWDWKRDAEQATRDMDRTTIIDFYRNAAANVQRRLGVDLTSQPASEAARSRKRK